MVTRARATLLFALVMALGAGPEPTKQPTLIELRSGLNEIDLDRDGTPDAVVKAWRENFNAHSFFNYTFYRRTSKEWLVIPIEREPRADLTIGFDSGEGADCGIAHLRLYQSDKGVQLIIGVRELGESYADSRPVTFSWYSLKRNEDGIPGWPSLYFSRTKLQTTKKEYCDVDEAFERELHSK